MKLYFIRHGKTEWNEEERLQGKHGDSPLLQESFLEIEKLGNALADHKFSKIYCSPSLRTRKTAQGIYAKLHTPTEITFKEGLREFGLGELEGERISIAQEKFPDEMYAFRNDLSKYNPSAYHGEVITSVLDRVSRVVMEAILENEGDVLFVSHGATLTASIRYLAGFELNELRANGGLLNNSVSILETDNLHLPFKLIQWNDVSYLEK